MAKYGSTEEINNDNRNIPLGLKTLSELNEIHVHQHLDLAEVLLRWERNNRYSVYDSNDEQFLYIHETSVCFWRQCLGSARAFTLKFTDNDQVDIMKLERPIRCTSRCLWWCCCLQEMEIQTPPGTMAGRVQEAWTCCYPTFNVYDKNDELSFKMIGECCNRKCGCDLTFRIVDKHDEDAATVVKHWGGCRQVCGAVNEFTIKYLTTHLQTKLLILGAIMLIDSNYFDRRGICC